MGYERNTDHGVVIVCSVAAQMLQRFISMLKAKNDHLYDGVAILGQGLSQTMIVSGGNLVASEHHHRWIRRVRPLRAIGWHGDTDSGRALPERCDAPCRAGEGQRHAVLLVRAFGFLHEANKEYTPSLLCRTRTGVTVAIPESRLAVIGTARTAVAGANTCAYPFDRTAVATTKCTASQHDRRIVYKSTALSTTDVSHCE